MSKPVTLHSFLPYDFAFAKEVLPDWVKNPPQEDGVRRYYLGEGRGKSVDEARKAARSNALHQVVEQIQYEYSMASKSVERHFAACGYDFGISGNFDFVLPPTVLVCEPEYRRFFYWDSDSRQYTYYTLLVVSEDYINIFVGGQQRIPLR
jgi:hypothetical protein